MPERTQKTPKQLARLWNRPVAEVEKAWAALDPTGRKTVPISFQDALAQRLGVTLETSEEEDESEVVVVEAPLQIAPDKAEASPWTSLDFRAVKHPLWIHAEVLEVTETAGLGRRLGLVLQQLAAHKRTSVVKGCRGQDNAGWLRSPLGGNQGKQYYLWWAPAGHPPTKELADLPAQGILVRAVRHHDDHASLAAGNLDDCWTFSREKDADGLVESPWTADQLEFVRAEQPVRVVIGQPGAGKTTVLWKAIEAHREERVLYLTWSVGLVRAARERFESFAPAGVSVEVCDFLSFLSQLGVPAVARQPLAESREIFLDALRRLAPRELGEWGQRREALFAEVRAFLLGRATGDLADLRLECGLLRVTDAAYLAARRPVLKEAAPHLLKVFKGLDGQVLKKAFPELVSAAAAIERLRSLPLPVGLDVFDRIVIDEVQDLTLLEATVVVEFCRALDRESGWAPRLLIAGDDGQTVRPSGFSWGTLCEVVGRRIAPPQQFHLEENLRCPAGITAVLARVSQEYGRLSKTTRPTKQGARGQGQPVNAQLLHIRLDDPTEAIELLEFLDTQDEVVVVTAGEVVPAWVPVGLVDSVLRPEVAKGLEYQAVVVLEPGPILAALRGANSTPLEEHHDRLALDQLRVALSRATETLVFVDVGAPAAALERSWHLLGPNAMVMDPESLAEVFSEQDWTPEDRILARTREARALVEQAPRRAWLRAHQAVQLLGEFDQPTRVADPFVVQEAFEVLREIAAHLLVGGLPARVHLNEIDAAVEQVLKHMRTLKPAEMVAWDAFRLWAVAQSRSPLPMLAAAAGTNNRWLQEALGPARSAVQQALRMGTTVPGEADKYAGDVEAWLDLAAWRGDLGQEARTLRAQAFDTLLAGGLLAPAEDLLKCLGPAEHARRGRLRERQQRYPEAAEAFEEAGEREEALRVWRVAGRWERAITCAEPETEAHQDLTWLMELTDLMHRRPAGHALRLTTREREGLGRLLSEGARL